MARFRWTQDQSVFVPELDAEHRNLFELARIIQAGAKASVSPATYVPEVRALLAAEEEHFLHEERLMQRAHYPLMEWHKRLHDTARKRAAGFLERIEAGDAEAGAELLEFLSGWLHDHLAIADRMMAAALRAHGRMHEAVRSS